MRLASASYLGVPATEVYLDRRCPTCGLPHGKVRLPRGAGLEVSVSHAGNRVGVAFADGVPVGLDVESVNMGVEPDEIAQIVLSPVERTAFEHQSRSSRLRSLLRLWVRKEAVVKATGEGLSTPLTDLIVSGPDEVATVVSWHTHPHLDGLVQVCDLVGDRNHVSALAVLSSDMPHVRERSAASMLAAAQHL